MVKVFLFRLFCLEKQVLDLFSEKEQKSAAVAEGVGLCTSPVNGLLNAKKTSLLVAPQAHMGHAHPEMNRKFRKFTIAVCRSLDFACLFPDLSILCGHKWSIFSHVSSLHTASLEHHRTVQYLSQRKPVIGFLLLRHRQSEEQRASRQSLEWVWSLQEHLCCLPAARREEIRCLLSKGEMLSLF